MQTIYQKMETTELDAAIEALKAEVAEVKAKGLALDMARGKPSPLLQVLGSQIHPLVRSIQQS